MWEPLLLAIGLTALAAVGIHLFQMNLRGGFLAAILVYSLLLTFAFSAALFRYFRTPGPATLLLAVGKALFLASDVFLLFQTFLFLSPPPSHGLEPVDLLCGSASALPEHHGGLTPRKEPLP